VYIGVGPEQNFSYIARLRPAMALIVDIRRENLSLHLMYKALFELSADRADFVSRLFSRERPTGLRPNTPVQDLFRAYAAMEPARRLHEANAQLIRQRLLGTHEFPLSADALVWIDYALDAFYSDGPDIQYGRLRPKDAPGPSYRDLMTAVDIRGRSRSYLASEEGFAFVKDLQARNMIVPIVGSFAGPTAIRGAGDYIRDHGENVAAFYGSNVEVYLNKEQIGAFCGNLATLPYVSRTWFIESKGMQPFRSKLNSCPPGARGAETTGPIPVPGRIPRSQNSRSSGAVLDPHDVANQRPRPLDSPPDGIAGAVTESPHGADDVMRPAGLFSRYCPLASIAAINSTMNASSASSEPRVPERRAGDSVIGDMFLDCPRGSPRCGRFDRQLSILAP
jgi:hypothetical protein